MKLGGPPPTHGRRTRAHATARAMDKVNKIRPLTEAELDTLCRALGHDDEAEAA